MRFVKKRHLSDKISKILALNGDEFVAELYKNLLYREPDELGLEYYSMRLLSGYSKQEVLVQFVRSPEFSAQFPLSFNVKVSAFTRTTLRKMRLVRKKQAIRTSFRSLLSDSFSVLSLEELNKLNPTHPFSNLDEFRESVDEYPPKRIIFFSENASENAAVYIDKAISESLNRKSDVALTYLLWSTVFKPTSIAYEHIGNHSLNLLRYTEAIKYYELSLSLGNANEWVYLNLAICLQKKDLNARAIDILIEGLNKSPTSNLIYESFDDFIKHFWNISLQNIETYAQIGDLDNLEEMQLKVCDFICKKYNQFFNVLSPNLSVQINKKNILIIGLHPEILPQCYRYRMEQKIDQLQAKGYRPTLTLWDNHDQIMNDIIFNDIIIFYRVPGLPLTIKQVEFARSLGKITFFEIDDLMFESKTLPSLPEYRGAITYQQYISLLKDAAMYKAMVKNCDYVISSTVPLLEAMLKVNQNKIGYLHRNGLDKYNVFNDKKNALIKNKPVNIFYGSGTLAHNVDFIEELLPALTFILRKYPNTRLSIAGMLTLPHSFITEFESRINFYSFSSNLENYWQLLKEADINLAVLSSSVLTDCKSEIKWIEASCFCVPSIVSNTRNYRDVIENGKTGLIADNASDWYKHLETLVVNSELRHSIGNQAHKTVVKNYSIDYLGTNLNMIINDAVSKKNELRY